MTTETTEPTSVELVEIVRARLSDGRTIADDHVRRLVDEIDRLSRLLTEARTGWRVKNDEAYRLRSGMERLLMEIRR